MKNEKTESLELVPVETVEADLIFSPVQGESQLIGYGSRKIIRKSIVEQLKPYYPIFQGESSEVTTEIVSTQGKKSRELVLNAISTGVCTRPGIALQTGLSISMVRYLLVELNDAGLIDVTIYRGTYHYKIHE